MDHNNDEWKDKILHSIPVFCILVPIRLILCPLMSSQICVVIDHYFRKLVAATPLEGLLQSS